MTDLSPNFTEEEFTPIKAQRKQWREKVRQIEKELGLSSLNG